jgi:hypothetical protein
MAERAWTSEAHEAVEELQAYLSDEVAPLLVVDSFEILLALPPAIGVEAIRAWVDGQLRAPSQQVTLGDYLFHAVKKVHLLGRLKLVDGAALQTYVAELIEGLVQRVPETERAALRPLLLRATEGEATFASSAAVLHRPATGAGEAPLTASQAVSAEVAASMRQFAQLLDRLGASTANPSARAELAPQLLAAAAESARTQGELEQYLAALSRAGLMTQARLPDVFATLGQSVPNWWVASEGGAPVESAPIAAMHRIVALAGDPEQTRSRFRHLLDTAAQQFNAGAVARAVQVLEVAGKLLAEGKVDKAGADLMLGGAHEDLDATQLMALTKQAASLPLLRRLLGYYPALTPEGLLAALDDEPDRAKRRLWIALLEAHDVPARQASLDRLERSFEEDQHGSLVAWRQRNFVYLLHRIRPPDGEDPQREIQLSDRCADLSLPAPLIREALINLGQRHHPDAEVALRQRLEQIERLLEAPDGGPHDPPELRRMLALVASGLVRQGTPSAWRAVVEHGLQQKAHLGDTLERLAELGSQDLTSQPQLVDRLLTALRSQLPVKVLGLNIRRHEGAHHLVRALQGTRSEAVRRALVDIARRFPGEELGQAAAAALAAWEATPQHPAPQAAAPQAAPQVRRAATPEETPPQPAVSLAGDLEAFGLPELLQTLLQTQASGRLVLRGRDGRPVGALTLRDGLLRAAQVRDLPLPDAFYQLVEVPAAGTFEFTRQPTEAIPAGPARDLMGLLMEGMRRYDELQRARALAPDHGFLRGTGSRPTSPPEDSDGAFVRAVWTRVKDGATPKQCEEFVAADAYRIRTLLVHWLNEGSLELRTAAENAPP